ncbi:FAD-dependent oxidoreductase [Paraburkholderia aspalathi]|uniref:FAD-dependent oxidoreductase n=1 Tax=Paraburkholderia aspalathi TaxID=1324617 RepID=UPI0038BC939A
MKTTVDATPAAVHALFTKFQADKAESGKPVAVVSGGSISGYATALALKEKGFNVLVVEKREDYRRQNVFSLKQDAIFSLARLAPDLPATAGEEHATGLLRAMRDKKLLTVAKNKVERDGMELKLKLHRQHRFMDWVVPSKELPSMIPQMKRTGGGVSAYLDAAEPHPPRDVDARDTTIRAAHLDPAWPDHQLVGAVKPDDWQLGDPKEMNADNLVFSQVMDLEKGLNDYCATPQVGINILRADVQLQNGGTDDRFVPILKVGDELVHPDFPVDLICVAEGSRSPNRLAIGGDPAEIDPNESWHQGNYIETAKDTPKPGGFEIVEVGHNPLALTVTQYIEQGHQSLTNISVYAPTNNKPGETAARAKLENAQAHIEAGGATALRVNEDTRQFDSGEIDVKLLRAKVPVKGNVVLVGDAVASGSPAGGYGASLSLSAYPEAIGRLVSHPLFQGSNGVLPKELQDAYSKDVSDIAEVRHGRPNDSMRSIGIYAPATGANVGRQIAKARFGKLG